MATCPPTREQVFSAVFNLVTGLSPSPFNVVTRRYIRPSAVEAINTPMLMTWEQPEKTEGSDRGLRKRWWEVWYIIVHYNNDQNVAGATLLNPLIDAVEAAFAPDNPVHQTQTLGGLVQAVYIDGPTVKAISDVDIDHGQGGAVIPVRILVP
jgi:hypothetical protein